VGSAITALDLCAAALARRSGLVQGQHEGDIETLNVAGKTTKKAQAVKSQLRQPALNWVTGVTQDPDYAILLRTRHALTHRRLPRHISVSTSSGGSTNRRLSLAVGAPLMGTPTQVPTQVGSRQLVELSVNLATRHMESLFADIVAGRH
jgi:hypothetical protein